MQTCNPLNALLTLAVALAAGNAQAAFPTCAMVNTEVATGSDPIGFVRMALRADGRPLLVYSTDLSNATTLVAYDCADLACSSGTGQVLGSINSRFGDPGVAIRGDERPLITSSALGALRLYDCTSASCFSSTFSDLVPVASGIGGDLPLLLQGDGNPLLLYRAPVTSPNHGALVAHFCTDAQCTGSGREVILDTPPSMSQFDAYSLTLDSQGNPVASYLLSDGASNRYGNVISVCSGSPACSTITTTQISGPVGRHMPWHTALVVRSDQRPLVLDNRTDDPALLDCATPACTSVQRRSLPAAEGQPLGLALLPGDRPAFARFSAAKVAAYACADSTCSNGSEVSIATAQTAIRDGDFKLDAGQRPVIAWIDLDTRRLSLTRCLADVLFTDGFD